MTKGPRPSNAESGKRLTSQGLVRDFGIRSAIARQAVPAFYRALTSADHETLADWQTRFGLTNDRDLERLAQYAGTLARRYTVAAEALDPAALWFALQSYYAALLQLLTRRFVAWAIDDLPGGNPYRWCFATSATEVAKHVAHLAAAVGEYDVGASCLHVTPTPADDADLLKALYQDLFPRRLRHRLGEFYTPDWLARHVLDKVGFAGNAGQRVLDPSCGSGTFLVLALQRLRQQCPPPEIQNHLPGVRAASAVQPFPAVVGCDVNPLAVLTARANYVMALHGLLPTDKTVEIPVYLADSILDEPSHAALAAPFDFVVGNPPWIAWDNLSAEYRRASQPLWQQYGLFSLSGTEARHGGGKKDLSMLMLYRTADRHLKADGQLGMVITQTLFQTKGAGDGFRRFSLGPDGAPLCVTRVDDMVAACPFDDAANWTSVVFMRKGQATKYPVPYFVWEANASATAGRGSSSAHATPTPEPKHSCQTGEIAGAPPLCVRACWARPVDAAQPSSPWIIQTEREPLESPVAGGASDYTAHLGANSGGANAVYWLEVLEHTADGVRIRNLVGKAKQKAPIVEWVVEPDLLYPLVCWGDVQRYAAAPKRYILLVQDVVARTGITAAALRECYPRTFAYLEQFYDILTARAAYRRYQHRGPFYSMYNVGEYTVAPIKVVWRRMDQRINAAVLETVDDPLLGRRPVVPQETCVLVACDSTDEAHYLCALLNSEAVNQRVTAQSVRGGKGFGTPSVLESLGLRRYDPENPRHRELAAASRQAHAAIRKDGL